MEISWRIRSRKSRGTFPCWARARCLSLSLSFCPSVCLSASLEFREFFDEYRERRVSRNIFDVLIEKREKRKNGNSRGEGIKRRRWISKFGKKYLAGEIQARGVLKVIADGDVTKAFSAGLFPVLSPDRLFPPHAHVTPDVKATLFSRLRSPRRGFRIFSSSLCKKRSTNEYRGRERERDVDRSEWGKIRLREFE